MTITAEQIRAARKLLGWSYATLAKRAGRRLMIVSKIEAGATAPQFETAIADIRHAFEVAGVAFNTDSGIEVRTPSEPSSDNADPISGKQIAEARRLLGWSQAQLCRQATIGKNTLYRIEAGETVRGAGQARLRAALVAAGVEFMPDNGGGAGVKLRSPALLRRGTVDADDEA